MSVIILSLVSDDGKVNVWATQESATSFAVYSEHTAFHADAGSPTRFKDIETASRVAHDMFEKMKNWSSPARHPGRG